MHYFLCDLVLDIFQNGIEAGASLLVLSIEEKENSSGERIFGFSVKDNGKGMDEKELQKALDPFYTDGIKHPGRKIGLGLPFLVQTAEVSGGSWEINSGEDGTEVKAWFSLECIDTPPIGDIEGLFRSALLFKDDIEIVLRYNGNLL